MEVGKTDWYIDEDITEIERRNHFRWKKQSRLATGELPEIDKVGTSASIADKQLDVYSSK